VVLRSGRKRRGDAHLFRKFYAATNCDKLSVARLCGPVGASIPETNDSAGVCRRSTQSSLTAEDVARERDPAYLAQMRTRKAMLQAQAGLLRAQEPCLEAMGTAD